MDNGEAFSPRQRWWMLAIAVALVTLQWFVSTTMEPMMTVALAAAVQFVIIGVVVVYLRRRSGQWFWAAKPDVAPSQRNARRWAAGASTVMIVAAVVMVAVTVSIGSQPGEWTCGSSTTGRRCDRFAERPLSGGQVASLLLALASFALAGLALARSWKPAFLQRRLELDEKPGWLASTWRIDNFKMRMMAAAFCWVPLFVGFQHQEQKSYGRPQRECFAAATSQVERAQCSEVSLTVERTVNSATSMAPIIIPLGVLIGLSGVCWWIYSAIVHRREISAMRDAKSTDAVERVAP